MSQIVLPLTIWPVLSPGLDIVYIIKMLTRSGRGYIRALVAETKRDPIHSMSLLQKERKLLLQIVKPLLLIGLLLLLIVSAQFLSDPILTKMMRSTNDSRYIESVLKTYGDLSGDLHLVSLHRDGGPVTPGGLGLSLAGNRDLATMSVFVVGIQPSSLAAQSGLIRVGDELLEINGQVLYGRSHLNSSAIIKSVKSQTINVLLLRSEDSVERMAVSPLNSSHVIYKEENSTLIPKKPKSLSIEDSVMSMDGADSRLLPCANDLLPVSAGDTGTKPGLTADLSSNGKSCSNTDAPSNNLPLSSSREFAGDTVISRLQSDDRPNTDTSHTALPTNVSGIKRSDDVIGRPSPGDIRSRLEDTGQGQTDRGNDSSNHNNESRDTKLSSDTTAMHPVKTSDKSVNDIATDATSTKTTTIAQTATTIREDPTTSNIVLGRATVIEIRKEKMALGMKIVGGCDSLLKQVLVYEIYRDGAIWKDGRISVGDQLLEINGVELNECSGERCVQLLRQAGSSSIRFKIFRDGRGLGCDELYDRFSVELMKRPGKGLGISIVCASCERGIVVSDVVKGGVAEADGRLRAGDLIETVNGDDLRKTNQEQAAELLKTLMGKINLSVRRLRLAPSSNNSHSTSQQNNSTSSSARNGSKYSADKSASSIGIKKSESNISESNTVNKRIVKKRSVGCSKVVSCLGSED